jgi:hypothetical protein
MQLHGALEIFPRHMLERTYLDDAGVVDQDIDLAETVDYSPDRTLNFFPIKQITLSRLDCAAAPGELRFCPSEFLGLPCNERDLSARCANVACQNEAKPAGPACDKNDLVTQRVTRCADQPHDHPSDEDDDYGEQENAKIHLAIYSATRKTWRQAFEMRKNLAAETARGG